MYESCNESSACQPDTLIIGSAHSGKDRRRSKEEETRLKYYEWKVNEVIVFTSMGKPVVVEMTNHSENQVTQVSLESRTGMSAKSKLSAQDVSKKPETRWLSLSLMQLGFVAPFRFPPRSWASSLVEFRINQQTSQRDERDTEGEEAAEKLGNSLSAGYPQRSTASLWKWWGSGDNACSRYDRSRYSIGVTVSSSQAFL